MKIEKENMNTISHSRGSKENHSRRKVKKEDAKANSKRMSQEEIDKEIVEMKEQLNVLRMILEENQRLGWVLKKKVVKWYKLQRRLQKRQVKWLMENLREAQLEMEVSICEPQLGEVLGEEERIIDDFLKCWTNIDQQEHAKPYIVESNNFDVITGFAEDEQSLEAIKSVEEYLSEDKNFEVNNAAECLLNEKSSELLQQKEFSNTLMFEATTTQGNFLVKGDEINSKELICEAIVETVEPCNFQTDNLCINERIIGNDEVLMNYCREIELLEYLLGNSKYDSVIADEGVHYSGQEQKDIIREDDVEGRLTDSLESTLEDSLEEVESTY